LLKELDSYDRRILETLQGDATCSMAELGQKVGLSHTPCWRRMKRLEEEGVIQARVTLLSPERLNLGVTVFVYIENQSHKEVALEEFEHAVQEITEVMECHSTSGEKDYVLKIIVDSVVQYEQILKTKLAHLPNVASINSTFALKRVKYTTRLPLE